LPYKKRASILTVSLQFIEGLYEDFDFDASIKLAKEMGKAASEDILLKPYATEIQA